MVLLPGGEEEEPDHDHAGEGHSHEYDPRMVITRARDSNGSKALQNS